MTKKKVLWVHLSCLRYGCQRCTLAVAQHSPSPNARGHSIFGKYLNTHFKFMVYGRKHTSMLPTHFRNTVLLVWSLLRLAPIIQSVVTQLHGRQQSLIHYQVYNTDDHTINIPITPQQHYCTFPPSSLSSHI